MKTTRIVNSNRLIEPQESKKMFILEQLTKNNNTMIRSTTIEAIANQYSVANPDLGITDIINLMYIDDKITVQEFNHLTA